MMDRALRAVLATLLPRPRLFRLALRGASILRPLAALLPASLLQERLAAMLSLAPPSVPGPSPVDRPQVIEAEGTRRARVALLSGCAQPVLAPGINEATVRLLTRHGVEVVIAAGAGCCGALTHHMGKEAPALRSAKANIDAWLAEADGAGLDAVVINASGCGTTVKDYGFMLRDDPVYAPRAARVSALAKDVTELLDELGLKPAVVDADLVVAYHSACSMQHGQQIQLQPKRLLAAAGFIVVEPAESHICCGSAGTYNLLQPAIAGQLRKRKVDNIEALRPDVIATGNIGCLTQIGSGTVIPIGPHGRAAGLGHRRAATGGPEGIGRYCADDSSIG